MSQAAGTFPLRRSSVMGKRGKRSMAGGMPFSFPSFSFSLSFTVRFNSIAKISPDSIFPPIKNHHHETDHLPQTSHRQQAYDRSQTPIIPINANVRPSRTFNRRRRKALDARALHQERLMELNESSILIDLQIALYQHHAD